MPELWYQQHPYLLEINKNSGFRKVSPQHQLTLTSREIQAYLLGSSIFYNVKSHWVDFVEASQTSLSSMRGAFSIAARN